MKGIRKFNKGDIVLLLIIGIIGIAVSVPMLWNQISGKNKPDDSLIAVVTRNGKTMAEIDLNKIQEPKYVNFDDGISVSILAEKGSIRFVDADCPDKICIKTGTLTKPGDIAVCMPSKTIVTIKGEGNRVGLFAKRVVIYE